MASADSKHQRVTHGIPLNLSGEGLGCHILYLRCESFISLDGRLAKRKVEREREMRIFCLCKSEGIKDELMSCFLNRLCCAAHMQGDTKKAELCFACWR